LREGTIKKLTFQIDPFVTCCGNLETDDHNFKDGIDLSGNPAGEPKNCETKPKLTLKCGCKELKKSYEEKTESQMTDLLLQIH
jgi:hypothetical protein